MNICMFTGYSVILLHELNINQENILVSKFESYKLPCVLCIAITTASLPLKCPLFLVYDTP